jgi:tetratricopeptide (TPR) repeat protein
MILSIILFLSQISADSLAHTIEFEMFHFRFEQAYKILNNNKNTVSTFRYDNYKSVIYFFHYFSEQPSRRNPAFLDSMIESSEFTISQEEKILSSKNTDDILMLGGAYGFKGMALYLQKSQFSALKHASKAKDVLDDLISKDPTQIDAYFGIGIYNYALSQPPAILRFFLSILGYKGDYEKGMEQLNTSAKFGKITQVQSLLFLVNHSLYENKYYSTVYPLFNKFPDYLKKTPMFLYKKAQFEFELYHFEACIDLAEAFEKEIVPIYMLNYTRLIKGKSYYRLRKFEKAVEAFLTIKKSLDPLAGQLGFDLEEYLADSYIALSEKDKALRILKFIAENTSSETQKKRVQNRLQLITQ